MAESSLPPQSESLQPPVQFFYGEHYGEENAAVLAAHLQEYDVVAMEYVVSAEKRPEIQAFANKITNAADEAEAVQIMEDDENGYFYYNNFDYTLMKALAGSHKKIVLVDANAEEVPEAAVMREAAKEQDEKIVSEPPEIVMGYAKKMAMATLAMNSRREHIVARQVEQLAETLLPGERLAVFQGAAHTSTFIELKREGMNVRRDFIQRKSPNDRFPDNKHNYNLYSTLLRQESMIPNKPITEVFWKRLLLVDYASYSTWGTQTFEESKEFLYTVEQATLEVDEVFLDELFNDIEEIRLETHPEDEDNVENFRTGIKSLIQSRLLTDLQTQAA